MTTFSARPYSYADSRVYQPGRYILLAHDGDHSEGVGGALVVKGEVIAYAGMPGDGGSLKSIIKNADTYVWGATIKDALAKIRHALEAEMAR